MPQRDFRNTLGFLDLMARENYQRQQQQNQNQIDAERRQAEYAGMGQLLKGVGQEQERIRAGQVKKAGAQGMGAALDDRDAPEDSGDVELDGSALEGYNQTRLKMEANKATMARLLANRDKSGWQEELARSRLDQGERRLDALENHRYHQYGEHDEDQQLNLDRQILSTILGIDMNAAQPNPLTGNRNQDALSRMQAIREAAARRYGGGAIPSDQSSTRAPLPEAAVSAPPPSAPADTQLPPGDYIDIPLSEKKELPEQLSGVQKARQGAKRALRAIDTVPDDQYGRAQGGLGDSWGKLGGLGLNKLDEIKSLWDGDAEKRVDHRNIVQGEVDQIINDLNRYMNSSRATDRDRENISRALGMANQKNIFSTKKEAWHKILGFRDKLLENDEKILTEEARTGRRRTVRPDVPLYSEGFTWDDEQQAPAQATPQRRGGETGQAVPSAVGADEAKKAAYVRLRQQGLSPEEAMAKVNSGDVSF